MAHRAGLLCHFRAEWTQKFNTVVNQEWHSIDFRDPRGQIVFGILVFLTTVTLVKRRRWMLYEFLFLLLAVYAAFRHLRFLFLLGIVLCPILAREWKVFSPYCRERDKPALNALVMLALAIFCMARIPTQAKLKLDIAEGESGMPAEAVKFLRANPPRGHVLNDINWGGYLVWYAPEIPVFADSRDDIFDHHGILGDYVSAIELQSPLEILDRYQVNYIFFAKSAPLVYLLRNTRGWKIDYENGNAIFFERINLYPLGPS